MDKKDKVRVFKALFTSSPPCDGDLCYPCCWTCQYLKDCAPKWYEMKFNCRRKGTPQWCQLARNHWKEIYFEEVKIIVV